MLIITIIENRVKENTKKKRERERQKNVESRRKQEYITHELSLVWETYACTRKRWAEPLREKIDCDDYSAAMIRLKDK